MASPATISGSIATARHAIRGAGPDRCEADEVDRAAEALPDLARRERT